jgi:hypothetical protein
MVNWKKNDEKNVQMYRREERRIGGAANGRKI